jgi:excisionase family DNA binding protein
MTHDEFIDRLERQIAAEKAYESSAPVASVLSAVLDDVRQLQLESSGNGDRPDRMLRAEEVARRLSVSVRTVYKNRKGWPFAKELPGRSVRFSEQGLEKWLARR